MTSFRVFLGTAPGLEGPLLTEVRRILVGRPTDGEKWAAADRLQVKEGGIELNANQAEVWRLALTCRGCSSIKARLGRPFEAQNVDQFVRRFGRLPWRAWLPEGTQPAGASAPRVTAVCRKSLVYHTGAVEERAERWLSENLKYKFAARRPETSKPPTDKPKKQSSKSKQAEDENDDDDDDDGAELHIRLSRNQCSASLSLGRAGPEHHYQRGYRHHVVSGSIRETVAASLMEATDWVASPPAALWNPFAGSGVFATEALLLSNPHFAPALRFNYQMAFEHYRNFDRAAFQAFLQSEALVGSLTTPPDTRFLLSDISPRALDAAKHNALELGFDPTFMQGSTQQIIDKIPTNAMVVGNLPYGKQCTKGPETLDAFYSHVHRAGRSDLLKRAFFLVAGEDPILVPHENLLNFRNGGLPVRFVRLRPSSSSSSSDDE